MRITHRSGVGRPGPDLVVLMSDTSARTQFILPNEAHIVGLGVDGIIVNIPASWSLMAPGVRLDEADVRSWLEPLAAFNVRMPANLMLTVIDDPGDLFDDAAWVAVADNFRLLAAESRRAGLNGLFLDNEEYFGRWQNFPEDYPPGAASRGLEPYVDQAAQRGREIMTAVREGFPDAVVSVAHGPYLSVPFRPGDPAAIEAQAGGAELHELRGAFFTGLLEGAGPRQILSDAGELYRLRTAAEFVQSHDHRADILPDRIWWDAPQPLLDRWDARVAQDHMVYTGEFPRGFDHTPQSFADTLVLAAATSDEMVFAYSERDIAPLLTPGAASAEWADALRSAADRIGSILRGGNGDDEIIGDKRDDVLIGGSGRDKLQGRYGDDLLLGGRGADALYGGRGRDALFGEEGRDILRGDRGDDVLYGGAGRDRLIGGRGADLLDGGPGDDRLTGGLGADIFVFSRLGGRDVVTDFEIGKDRLSNADGDLAPEDVSLAATRSGARVFWDGGSLTLEGVAADQLDVVDLLG